MKAIQNFLPRPYNKEVNRIFVKARPETAWQAARYFDMAEVSWIRFLFDLRTLPQKFTNGKIGTRPGLGVDDIGRPGSGFVILEEIPGREVVIGSVGRFWHLNIPFKEVSPDEFRDFDAPGYGKLA